MISLALGIYWDVVCIVKNGWQRLSEKGHDKSIMPIAAGQLISFLD